MDAGHTLEMLYLRLESSTKSMLAIHNISIMMWILYIDRKQYWKWTINSGANAHDKRTVSENSDKLDSWASSDIGEEMGQFSSHSPYSVGWVDRRLFHSDSATVSQCDNFCCYMYLKLYMTSQRWRGFFFFFFFFFWGGGGGGSLISSVFSLIFGVVYWSRQPRVLRRFTALLLELCVRNVHIHR